METTLRSGGRVWTVRLAQQGDEMTATVGDATHRLVCLPAGTTASTPDGRVVEELALVVDGRVHRVVVARGRDRVLVALAGGVYVFETGEDAAGGGAGTGAGSGMVIAPMPGKIVAVLVREGETVEAGQAVAILEAMKMESTLAAEVSGTVASTRAQAGDMVDAGTIVVTITPRT